jgi:competence protein ComGC
MNLLLDFWAFLRERKKWWLLPIILVLLLIGALILFLIVGLLLPAIQKIRVARRGY